MSSFEVRPGKLLIGGEWVEAASGERYSLLNPATESTIVDVAAAGAADVDRAVAAARKAFESDAWKNMRPRDRGRLLWKIADKLQENIEEMAYLETIHNGKPIIESKFADMGTVIDTLQYYAGWATKIGGDVIPVGPNSLNYTLREPLGVIGAIVAWNFPLMLAIWKIAPALATGNTVVIKPAPNTPLTLLRFAEIAQSCGLPPGVLNVLTGPGPELGEALVDHPDVDKIAFTGSTPVGKRIMSRAAATLKKVSLELGGKSPNIVFADADVEAALKGATAGIFYGKGEVCAAGSRLLVQSSIYDEFVEKLAGRAKKTVAMDPLNTKSRLGALASEMQLNKVQSYVQIGKDEGATLLAGGNRVDIGTGKGYFHEATVFADVKSDMRLSQEEIFGPVLAVQRFEDLEDALRQANGTSYGLAAAVWTQDVKKAHRVARALKAGTVWVNAYNNYDASVPFGGYKQSGFGREMGEAALEGYTQVKAVWVDLGA